MRNICNLYVQACICALRMNYLARYVPGIICSQSYAYGIYSMRIYTVIFLMINILISSICVNKFGVIYPIAIELQAS